MRHIVTVTPVRHIVTVSPPVAALVKLLHAGDELVPIDATHDGGQPVHQAQRVLSPRHLHAAHLVYSCVNIINLII